MGRRTHKSDRCDRCRTHVQWCVCAEVPTLDLQTHVALVAHKRELTKPTMPGRLALLALTTHSLHEHGQADHPLDLTHLVTPERRLLVLFPAEGAQVLDATMQDADPRPVTLVVPEGTWRQASKVARRVPGLEHAEPVVLSPGPPTRYRLRREPRAGGLATMEAIARALGVLEGPDTRRVLEQLFDLWVERTLYTRGSRITPPP